MYRATSDLCKVGIANYALQDVQSVSALVEETPPLLTGLVLDDKDIDVISLRFREPDLAEQVKHIVTLYTNTFSTIVKPVKPFSKIYRR